MVKTRTREQLENDIETFCAGGEPESTDFGGMDSSSVRKLPTENCEPWPYHNRSQLWLTGTKQEQLKASIKDLGQQQSGLVRASATSDRKFQIIFGLRRWDACKSLGITFDARVLPHDTPDALCARLMGTENDDSEDVSEFEKALSYRKLIEGGVFVNQNELAAAYRVSKQYVSKLMKASKLADVSWLTPILETMVTSVSIKKAIKLITIINEKNNNQKLKTAVESGLLIACTDADEVFTKLVACVEGDRTIKQTVLLQKEFKPVVSSTTAKSGTTTIKILQTAFDDDSFDRLTKSINKHLETLRARQKSTMVDS